jgi:hypothetical protein
MCFQLDNIFGEIQMHSTAPHRSFIALAARIQEKAHTSPTLINFRPI